MNEIDLRVKGPPPVPSGYERSWYVCKTCGTAAYYDYEPYISSSFTWLPCCGLNPRDAARSVDESEGLALATDQARLRKARRGVEEGDWILLQPKQVAKLLELPYAAELFRIMAEDPVEEVEEPEEASQAVPE